MPIFEIETDQGVFEIEADREPTQAEALQAISGQAQPRALTAGEQRRASVEPQLAANEELRQQNLNSALGGLPFYGATGAYKSGVQAGRDIGGEGVLGDVLGGLTGVGATLGTLFNPITKAAGNIPILAQAIGEQQGEISTGNLNPSLFKETATGEREVQPLVKFGDTTSTAANLGTMMLNAIQADPVNAALAIYGGVQGIKNPVGTVKAIARPIEAGIAKITPDAFKKDVGRVATDVFKPTTDTAKAELIKDIESGALHDDLRAVQEFGRPKNAEQMLENGLIATDNLITLHKDFVSKFPDEVISNADIAQSIRNEAASKELSTPTEKQGALDLAEKIDGERSLDRSFKLLQELNERRRAYFEKSSKGRATDLDSSLNALEQQARDQLSTKLDDFYRSQTGTTDNPYRQYGSLKGRLDDLTLRMNNLLTERNIEVSKGPSLDREVLATIKRNINLLKGGEKGRIDNRVAKMFDLLGKEETTNLRDLTPEEQTTLQQERTVEQANVAKSQAAKARAERGVEHKRVNETRAEYAKRLKQKRADLVAREGASPTELQQGGAAATTLSEMEKSFQSRIEADGLNKALMDVFPEVNKTERAIIERELQSATPKETRDIMSQLLNEQFQIQEQGAMTRISKDFDRVLRSIRKENEQRLGAAID